jgi:hypothetical protein
MMSFVVKYGWYGGMEGPNRVGVCILSPDNGNRSSFRNVVSLIFRILTDGRSPQTSDSEGYSFYSYKHIFLTASCI